MSSKWVPTNYINVLYVQILIWDQFGAKIPIYGIDLGKTSYKDLVFAWGEFFSVVAAQNESLWVILMYYVFKYWSGITTTLLESLRSQNTHFRARFRQTSYKDLVFARGEFLSVVGDPNESLRLIIIYYINIHF